MSRLYRRAQHILLPSNAKVYGKMVTWSGFNGVLRTGVLVDNKYVRIESPYWTVTYKDENDKTRVLSTNVTVESEAHKILNRLEEEVSRIRLGLTTREEIDKANKDRVPMGSLLDGFKAHIIAKNVTKAYANTVIKRVVQLFEDCEMTSLDMFTTEAIESWLANDIRKGIRTNSTLNHYIVAFGYFAGWCVRNKLLKESPVRYLKKLNPMVNTRRSRRSFTDDELDALLNAARNRKIEPEKQHLLYYVLVSTGLRINELLKAEVHQFDLKNKQYHVIAEHTKNRRPNTLPLRDDLVVVLSKHIKKYRLKPNDNLFGTYKKNLRDKVYTRFNQDLYHANIDKINECNKTVDLHSFRRTFGTMLARAGVPLIITQELLGHLDPKTTRKFYIEVGEVDKYKAVNSLKIKFK